MLCIAVIMIVIIIIISIIVIATSRRGLHAPGQGREEERCVPQAQELRCSLVLLL